MASKQEVVNFKDIDLDDITIQKIENNNEALTKYKIIREQLMTKNKEPIVFKLEGTVAFDCSKSKFADDKFGLTLNVDNDTISFIQNSFRDKIIDLVYESKDKNNHYKDDDDVDREYIEENTKDVLYKKEGSNYPAVVQLNVKEIKYHNILFNKFIKVNQNEDGEPDYKIDKNPNLEELLKRGTKVELLMCLRHIDTKITSIKPELQIMMIKIVKNNCIEKNYINWTKEEFEKHAFTLTEPTTLEGISGKKGYINCDGKPFSIKIKGGLAPFNIMNTDKTSGKEYYGISVSLKDEEIEASEYLYEQVSQELASQSNKFFGKKMTLKSICKKLATVQSMPKKDLENYKKKLPLEFSPTLGCKIYKKRDSEEYNFTLTDIKGEKMNPNELEEYKKEHKGAIYEIEASLQHIWYGETYSVKWILNTVKIIEDDSSGNVLYQGFDEDIQTETTTNDEPENNEDSDNDNHDNHDEPENNDEPENKVEPENSSGEETSSDEDSD